MLLRIGQPLDHDFCDPLGLLRDCHRRIERFLEVLLTVSRNTDNELNPEQRDAFALALKYFRDTAPLHTRDEEASLFPRMREKGATDFEAVLKLLDELHADHKSAGRRHKQVDELGSRLLRDGKLSLDDAHLFNQMMEDLARTYLDHILIEERVIFPLAANLLSTTALEEVGQEMASRRRSSM